LIGNWQEPLNQIWSHASLPRRHGPLSQIPTSPVLLRGERSLQGTIHRHGYHYCQVQIQWQNRHRYHICAHCFWRRRLYHVVYPPGRGPSRIIPQALAHRYSDFQDHYVFGAKSQKRLTAACEIIRYYETVGRPLTAANIQWDTVIKNFEIQWNALKAKKKEDGPETLKIAKGLNIMKWSEPFVDTLNRCIGVRMTALVYVIRESAIPPAITALAAGQPHSTHAGSIEQELIDRASHTHALFRDDNASTVYYKLEEATRGTTFAASIKPFQRMKNERGAYTAIITQFAGEDKWESEIKTKEAILHQTQWKGQSNYSLERHAAQHRNAYVSLVAEHAADVSH
jgi:hypothetical protein